MEIPAIDKVDALIGQSATNAEALIERTEAEAGNDVWLWIRAAQALQNAGETSSAQTLLREAARRFPKVPNVHQDLARLAEAVEDWSDATRCWLAFAKLAPTIWWGLTAAAHAVRRGGGLQEAEALLLEACDRFPDEPGPWTEYARFAELRGDLPEASKRWAVVVERFPQTWPALQGQVAALRADGRLDAAHSVLIKALERFPALTAPLQGLASLAEAARNWSAAERWWRLWVAFEPGFWWGFTGLANALREQGDLPQAGIVLAAEFRRFGYEPGFFTECGKLTGNAPRWHEAAANWAVKRKRFSQDWAGYGPQARALHQAGCVAEAEAILVTGAAQFPEQSALLEQLAQEADQRRDWTAAETWWRNFVEHKPWSWQGHLALADVLRERRRPDNAAEVLAAAVDRFPDTIDALIGIVDQVSRPGGALPEDLLLRLEAGIAVFASNPEPSRPVLLASALIARERRNWATYRHRSALMLAKWPDDRQASRLLSEANELALADGVDITPVRVAAGPHPDLTELALAFESLGGGWPVDPNLGGGGCEFGFFQRSLGAEPLSLLRWATIQPPDLLRGLSDGFQALDDGAMLELLPQGHYDWKAQENYYGIQIDHTHLDRDKVAIIDAYRMVRTRFRFLRRKLLDDLALGDKIFIYRLADTNVTLEEIEALGQAINRYGHNTLVFAMRAPVQSEHVVIELQRKGLMVVRLAPSAQPGMHIEYEAWLDLCRLARDAVRDGGI